jgi:UDP-N-acetylglucosamine--N-acetylmuramyl-(pentapeptide) pyrophosphoryl-undecaprenol N-acetylglucosamine transferase
MPRIVLTGGGTGGHIYPLVAVAEALAGKRGAGDGEQFEIHYVGYIGDYRKSFEDEGVTVHPIVGAKVRRYFSLQNILDVPKFFIGILQALWKLYFLMPDAIFSKGGTSSLPVILAGWFYRIPVMIHESDATPGLNNLIGSRFATRIAVSFESAAKYFNPAKTIVTGNPLRRELLNAVAALEAQPAARAAAAKQEFGFDPAQPLILIMGSSQGSGRINELVLLSLAALAKTAQVLHQTGATNYVEVEQLSRAALADVPVTPGQVPMRYDPVPYFVNNMGTALAAADLVVSRGSSSIFEIAAFGKPAILVPIFESANGHQRVNSYEFAEKGAAVVIEEPNLLPDIFMAQVRKILSDDTLRAQMSAASKAFATPNAAEKIAEEIASIA